MKLRFILGASLILILTGTLFFAVFEPKGESSDGQKEGSAVDQEVVEKGPVTSFQGKLYGVNDDGTISVDCTDAVYKADAIISYVCEAEITEDTLILGEDNQQLKRKDLSPYEYNVEIVIGEPTDLNEEVESRNVVAKEVRIIDSKS